MGPFLLALCGIPASGKTTFASRIQERFSSEECETMLVSTDEWRNDSYYSNFIPEKENAVRKNALEKTRQALLQRINVIHDDTNYYASMRHDLYNLAIEHAYAFGVVFIRTPLDIALEWNRDRERPLPDSVIEKINDRLDVPGSKYTWDTPIATVDMAKDDIDGCIDTIKKKLGILRPSRPLGKPVPGDAEFYDGLTRRIVHEFLKERKELRRTREISRIRKQVLKEAITHRMDSEEVRWTLLSRLAKVE